MMNFNPQNEQGILGLVAALQNGMMPDTAYSLFQGIQQDQASQMAQRQERLGGLAELIMGAGQSGMPYAGAEALADAAPGPMGPAVQQMLSSMYPTADAQAPAQPMNASGQPIQAPAGYYDQLGPAGVTPMGTPNVGPQATSPAFMPQEPSPTEAIAVQNMEQQQAIDQALSQFAAEVSQAKANNWPVEQVVAQLGRTNPELLAVANEQVQGILTSIYGELALSGIAAPGA